MQRSNLLPGNPRSTGGILMRVAAVVAMAALLVGGFVLISRNVNTGGLVAIGAGLLWFAVAGAGFLFLARGRRTEQRGVLATVTVTGLALGAVLFATSRGNEVDEKIVTGAPVAAPASSEGGAEADGGSTAAGGDARAGGRRASAGGKRSAAGRGRNDRHRKGGSPGNGGAGEVAAAPDGQAAAAGGNRGTGGGAPSPADDRPPARPTGNVQTLSGSFTGESNHRGKGRAAVVELPSGARKLTFSEFDVDPGAGGLRVYLTAGNPGSDADVRDFKDIGGLKGTKGDQQYDIPRDIDLKKYGTVVIWCVPFTTRIAQAGLR